MYEVRVTRLDNTENNKVLGLASLVVDGNFVFNGIKLMSTDNERANKGRGYNVVMPSYKTAYGEYISIFKPVTKNMHEMLSYNIHKAYESGETVSFGNLNNIQPVSVAVKQLNQSMQDSGTKKADVSLCFNKEFVCDSITVRENMSSGDLFVAYPSYRSSNGNGEIEYKSFCNPITKEFNEEIRNMVFSRLDMPNKNKGVELSKPAEPVRPRRYSKSK